MEFKTALSLTTLLVLLGLNAGSYYETFPSIFQELGGGSAWVEDVHYPAYLRLAGFIYPLVDLIPLVCMLH